MNFGLRMIEKLNKKAAFYSVISDNYNALKEIPEEMIEVSAELVSSTREAMSKDFSPFPPVLFPNRYFKCGE